MTVKLGNFWNCLLRKAECRRQAWLTACLIWKNIGRTDGSKFFGIFALYFEYLREKRIVVNLVTENFVDFLFMLERLFISLININNSHRYKLELIFIKNVFIMKYVAKVIFDVVVPHPVSNGMQNSTLDEFLIIGIILLPFLNTYFLFHTKQLYSKTIRWFICGLHRIAHLCKCGRQVLFSLQRLPKPWIYGEIVSDFITPAQISESL